MFLNDLLLYCHAAKVCEGWVLEEVVINLSSLTYRVLGDCILKFKFGNVSLLLLLLAHMLILWDVFLILAEVSPLANILRIRPLEANLIKLVLHFFEMAVEVVQEGTCVLRCRVFVLDTAPEDTLVVHLCLRDVANVVIFDGEVVVGAHLCLLLVKLPRQ